MNREFSICCLVTNRITCQDPQIIYKTLLALKFDIDHFFVTFWKQSLSMDERGISLSKVTDKRGGQK